MKSKNFPFSLIGIILLFQVLPLFLTSCLDDCSGEGLFYRITGLNGEALEYVETASSFQTQPWSNTKNLTTENLVLAFITDTQILNVSAFNPSKYGMPAAYACDPAFNVEAKIRQFELFSNKDFNSDYPSGSDLTGIILAETSNGFVPFESVMDRERKELKIESTYVRFTQASEQAEAQEFTCNITLTDGKRFSATVENIILRVN